MARSGMVGVLDPVRFQPAVVAAAEQGYRLFVDVGPHPALVPHLARCLDGVDCASLPRRPFDGQDWEEAQAKRTVPT